MAYNRWGSLGIGTLAPIQEDEIDIPDPCLMLHYEAIYPPRQVGYEDYLICAQHTQLIKPWSSSHVFCGVQMDVADSDRTAIVLQFEDCVTRGRSSPNSFFEASLQQTKNYHWVFPLLCNARGSSALVKRGRPIMRVKLAQRSLMFDDPSPFETIIPELKRETLEMCKDEKWRMLPLAPCFLRPFEHPLVNVTSFLEHFNDSDEDEDVPMPEEPGSATPPHDPVRRVSYTSMPY